MYHILIFQFQNIFLSFQFQLSYMILKSDNPLLEDILAVTYFKLTKFLQSNIITRQMSSEQQVEGTLFDFGTIAETQIMKCQDELFLPYNPFTFDIKLKIIKSIEPYQSNLQFSINSGCRSIFGRKKTEVEHVLKAPTVSSKHFVIDQQKKIYDLGSTKGTFIWIQRERPVELVKGKTFLIGNTQIRIQNISIDRKISIKTDKNQYQVTKKDNPILIGSDKRCHIKIKQKEYFAVIDVLNLKLHTFLEDEDYDCDNGVWEKLNPQSHQNQGRELEQGDIILVYPYILRVEY